MFDEKKIYCFGLNVIELIVCDGLCICFFFLKKKIYDFLGELLVSGKNVNSV